MRYVYRRTDGFEKKPQFNDHEMKMQIARQNDFIQTNCKGQTLTEMSKRWNWNQNIRVLDDILVPPLRTKLQASQKEKKKKTEGIHNEKRRMLPNSTRLFSDMIQDKLKKLEKDTKRLDKLAMRTENSLHKSRSQTHRNTSGVGGMVTSSMIQKSLSSLASPTHLTTGKAVTLLSPSYHAGSPSPERILTKGSSEIASPIKGKGTMFDFSNIKIQTQYRDTFESGDEEGQVHSQDLEIEDVLQNRLDAKEHKRPRKFKHVIFNSDGTTKKSKSLSQPDLGYMVQGVNMKERTVGWKPGSVKQRASSGINTPTASSRSLVGKPLSRTPSLGNWTIKGTFDKELERKKKQRNRSQEGNCLQTNENFAKIYDNICLDVNCSEEKRRFQKKLKQMKVEYSREFAKLFTVKPKNAQSKSQQGSVNGDERENQSAGRSTATGMPNLSESASQILLGNSIFSTTSNLGNSNIRRSPTRKDTMKSLEEQDTVFEIEPTFSVKMKRPLESRSSLESIPSVTRESTIKTEYSSDMSSREESKKEAPARNDTLKSKKSKLKRATSKRFLMKGLKKRHDEEKKKEIAAQRQKFLEARSLKQSLDSYDRLALNHRNLEEEDESSLDSIVKSKYKNKTNLFNSHVHDEQHEIFANEVDAVKIQNLRGQVSDNIKEFRELVVGPVDNTGNVYKVEFGSTRH